MADVNSQDKCSSSKKLHIIYITTYGNYVPALCHFRDKITPENCKFSAPYLYRMTLTSMVTASECRHVMREN